MKRYHWFIRAQPANRKTLEGHAQECNCPVLQTVLLHGAS